MKCEMSSHFIATTPPQNAMKCDELFGHRIFPYSSSHEESAQKWIFVPCKRYVVLGKKFFVGLCWGSIKCDAIRNYAYVACHFRYGALVFLPDGDLGRSWDKWDSGSKEFIRRFNASVKLVLKVPYSTANHMIRNFLGGFSAEATIYKNYYSSAVKWLRV